MRIAVLSTNRADASILTPLVLELVENRAFQLDLVVLGAGSESRAKTFELAGIPSENIRLIAFDPQHLEIDRSFLNEVSLRVCDYLSVRALDGIVILGDRVEMVYAALSCYQHSVPIYHLHGGEQTIGSKDDKYRDVITILADIHFVASDVFASRLENIGVSTDAIHVSGSLAVDLMSSIPLISSERLKHEFGLSPDSAHSILVCLHPETDLDLRSVESFFSALESLHSTSIVITAPNGDEGSLMILDRIKSFRPAPSSSFVYFENLGIEKFYSVLAAFDCFVGNSSAIVIESPYFGCPSLLVGRRQKGRPVAKNIEVIESFEQDEILATIESILINKKPRYGSFTLDHECFYGRGNASAEIVKVLYGLTGSVVG